MGIAESVSDMRREFNTIAGFFIFFQKTGSSLYDKAFHRIVLNLGKQGVYRNTKRTIRVIVRSFDAVKEDVHDRYTALFFPQGIGCSLQGRRIVPAFK